jgi:hypothetical protein
LVGLQSPSTRPDTITSAVRGWLEGFRAELAQLAQDKLDTYKQVGGRAGVSFFFEEWEGEWE